MKKGLSILLIAAALFGFYGGAVNLNDVLSCKDYWEVEGEKSTANLNKLEDGLNQLKDNEQAYLDGKEQVAEGEKALAEGEATLADGEAQYAEGLASYEAAPAKLAAGKQQLDDNRDSYTAGKAFKSIVDKSSNGLSKKGAFKIIKGLLAKTGTKGVPASYKEMADTRASLKKLKNGTDDITGMGSEKAFKVAVGTQDKATQKQLKEAGVTSYKALIKTIDTAEDGLENLNLVKENVDKFTGKKEDELKEMLVQSSKDLSDAGIKDYKTLAENEAKLRAGKNLIDKLAGMDADQLKNALVAQNEDLAAAEISDYEALAQKSGALTEGKKQIDAVADLSDSDLQNTLVKQSEALKAAKINDYETLAAKVAGLQEGKSKIDGLASMSESQRKDAFAQENGFESYKDITEKLEALKNGQAKIDGLAKMDPDNLRDTLVKESAALQDAKITSYSVLDGAVTQLSQLAELKSTIDNNADLDTKEKKDAAVKSQGIEGIEDYATLEEKVKNLDTLKAAKGKIDGIVSMDEAQRQDAFAKENGFESYADITGKIDALQQGVGKIDALAGMDSDTLKKTLVESNAALSDAKITTYTALSDTLAQLSAGKEQIDGFVSDRDAFRDYIVSGNDTLKAAGINDYATLEANEKALREGKQTIDAIAAMDEETRKDAFVGQNDELKKAEIESYKALDEKSTALTQGKATVDTVSKNLDNAGSDKAMAFVWTQLTDDQRAALKGQGVDGTSYAALKKAISGVKDTIKSLKTLKKGTDGVTNMKSNAALKTAIGSQDKATQKKLKNSGITSYKALKSAIGKLDQLAGFTNALTSQKGNSREKTYSNIISTLKNAGYGSMVSALPGSYRQLASKLAQYEAGVKEYRQGLADYEAAPGKLADAERQLEEGRQQLAEGRQQLAEGKDQLAQYEDGEQQVRDGLATLVGTEADLNLKSILDRLNGDSDFDNGDDHLDLDEGLSAVEVGRGYQAEDGELITEEIMGRAVGTGALLGAGVLAVIAAILSLLKKNKGSGVFALLAAAAGAFGAFYGTNAGTYFSDVAGSTAGNAGWIAAGILGVIALAHAIVHFTAGKEA